MPNNDKTLPEDFDSDDSLPGRFEESNPDFFILPEDPKPKNRTILVITLAFVMVTAGIFSYYFINQDEIDSRIIQKTLADPEQGLANQYGVGEYGSDHAHAAIAVFIEGEQVNFGLRQFQLTSKYIHFENYNPFVIHRHATGVPLEMLFASFEMKITQDCIILNAKSSEILEGDFCTRDDQSLEFFVNGEQFYSDISQYVPQHNDRILISFGDAESIPEYLAYLDALRIPDVPKKPPLSSGDEINI